MKNDKDSTINESEKEKKHFAGVIIKDRETLRNILTKAGLETIDHFCSADEDFIRDPLLGLKMVAMLSYLQVVFENAIMPRGIDEE